MTEPGTFSVRTAGLIVLSAIAASVLVGSIVFGGAGRRGGAASANPHSLSPLTRHAPSPSAASSSPRVAPQAEIEYPVDTSADSVPR